MTVTLESLIRECQRILAASNTRAGREQVAALVARALRDDAFIRAQFAGTVPERKILHEDPDLGFCILVHEYHDARQGGPHDHGPSWAIYGQAEGETVMADFELVEPPAPDRPAKVRKTRSYCMRPGDVHVYNEGDLHAPSRSGPTRLVRVEGVNMEKLPRQNYEVVVD
jgi:predicted metal-dependent enzyme (double-stranded beta helix superfamily)